MTKGILYLTRNTLTEKIEKLCKDNLKQIVEDGDYELVSTSFEPLEDMGLNVCVPVDGYEGYFKRLLYGLEAMKSDLVFVAEDDVIYPKEHFEFDPPDDSIYYDTNWWKVFEDGFAISWDADQVSGICAPREVLLPWYRNKVEQFNADTFDRKFEPLSGEGSKQWKAPRPHIDIRHGNNLTFSKRGLHHFRNKATAINFTESTIDQIPGWSLTTSDIY